MHHLNEKADSPANGPARVRSLIEKAYSNQKSAFLPKHPSLPRRGGDESSGSGQMADFEQSKPSPQDSRLASDAGVGPVEYFREMVDF